MITGISHITFIVKNLELGTLFFEKIFDAVEVYSRGDDTFSISREKFFVLNNLWICIMEGNPLNERSYNHIDFKINNKDYDRYLARIRELKLEE